MSKLLATATMVPWWKCLEIKIRNTTVIFVRRMWSIPHAAVWSSLRKWDVQLYEPKWKVVRKGG